MQAILRDPDDDTPRLVYALSSSPKRWRGHGRKRLQEFAA
jgi:hypothetical protein